MSPLNKPKTTLKSCNMTANHSEVVRKLCKPVHCPPSYNFTILSRPKKISEYKKVDEQTRKCLDLCRGLASTNSFSSSTPIPSGKENSLTKTIKKTNHISRDDKYDLFFMSSLHTIPWISAEHVIEAVEPNKEESSITSVTWAMTASDQSVVDAARDWFRSSSLSKRRTYTHGSISPKTIEKRRERSMKGYHPLCQTVRDRSLLAHPYL